MSELSPSSLDYTIHVKEEHEEYRKVIRDFSQKLVLPKVQKIESENALEDELVKRLCETGIMGITFPEEYGGAGADNLTLAIAVEELSRVCTALATLVVANYLVSTPIYLFGNEEQKRKYLAPLAKGQKIGAHAMTEAGAGSDVSAITTQAQKVDGGYRITGRKLFITNGDRAHIYLVFARTSPPDPRKRHLGVTAFIVERGAQGLRIGQRLNVIGLRGDQPVELIFEDVFVPEENVLGEIGRGVRIALSTYDRGRIGVAAQGVGIAQAALEAALKYSTQRETFGNKLLSYQQVQFKIAEMVSSVHAARILTYWAASLADQAKPFVKAASIAKIVATEAAERNAHAAMLIMGAYGVSQETGVERLLRDSQVIKTYEGTNDIQRLIVAREVAKEVGFAL